MHIFIIIIAVLFSLAALQSLFELEILPLIVFGFLAIFGWTVVSHGYAGWHDYLIWVLVYSIVSLIWNLLRGTLELGSIILGIITLCLLFA